MSTILDDLAALLSDTVTIEPLASRDQFGKATYGAAVSYSARVIYEKRRLTTGRFDSPGVDVVSTGTAYIAGTPAIGYDDRITLPDGSQPIIQMWTTETDENGPLYVRVVFGAA